MAEPTAAELKDLIEKVRFHLNDPDEVLFEDKEIRKALSYSLWDGMLAVYRLLLRVATSKAMMAKRAQLGNKTVEESPEQVLKLAEYYRQHAGEDLGDMPPLVSVHTDGTVGDGRSEFDKIGIEDVEEGERKDENIKPAYGDEGDTL